MNYKIFVFALLVGGIFLYGCSTKSSTEENNNKTTSNLEFGKENTQFRNTETKNQSPYAMFGDSSFVLMSEAERNNIEYLEILNQKDSKTTRLVMDSKTGKISLLDKNDIILKTFFIKTEDVAKFLSVDPLAKKYPDISPYAFVANSPLQYTDPDGRIIVDADGNIVATYISSGKEELGGTFKVRKGKNISTEVEFDYDEVTIYANDGTPVIARMVTEVRIVTTTFDLKTGETTKNIIIGSPIDVNCITNCHGLTFANEKLRISDPYVNDLIAGDKHTIVDKKLLADAIIFHDNKGNIVHSAEINEDDGTYNSNDGDDVSKYRTSLRASRRNGKSIDKKKDMFIKKTPNKVFNTNLGSTKNGIRLIKENEGIEKFKKDLDKELNKQ